MSKNVRHLFEQFQPSHYEIELHPDQDKLIFNGRVTITGRKVGRPSQRLTFHQKDLRITFSKIVRHEHKIDHEVTINRVNLHAGFDEVRLHAKSMLYPGQYTVTLGFEGKITKQMTGIYPCFFKHEGKTKKLIATQFESNHAREAFPCIDEPEAKAIFDLAITTPKEAVVLANSPIKSRKTSGTSIVSTFESTPKMSVYLLAFVFGEMHCVEKKTKSGVAVRSWATIAQPKKSLNYSVDEAIRVLDFFATYFDVPYPLAKLDQVALPDFDAGAMENWGLITYREIVLLTDPQNRSISTEQYVSLVVAHEISHQWFGNLVTMKWWDDLWLNESFASLMEHLSLDAIHPEWQQWELYTASDIIATSSRDVYKDIQPVGTKVTNPDLIEASFDPGIVYAKGGRLLKMLREYIGDEAFKRGLRLYFKKHAYSNTIREDLWKALSETSEKNISAIMTPWLVQPGMPIVHITQTQHHIQATQERFMLDGGADGSLWPVPLLASNTAEPDIFHSKSANITTAKLEYSVINQHASGHYFVHYTKPEHRKYLALKLKNLSLPTEARINLLNDIYMQARRGDESLTEALDLIVACNKEPRDSVWALVGRSLAASRQLTESNSKSEALLNALKRQLSDYWYKRLGWNDEENDDANRRQLRHTAIALKIGGEEPTTIQIALRQYKKAEHLQNIQAELRGTILSAAVQHGSQKVVTRLLKDYEDAPADVQLDITQALTSTKKPEVATQIITQALGPQGFVRSQDIMRWIALFMRNHYVRPIIWAFIIKEWAWIEETAGSSKSFDYLPIYCASVISTKEWAQKYHKFFESKKHIVVLQRNIEIGSADIGARIAWRDRDEGRIMQWLEKHMTA